MLEDSLIWQYSYCNILFTNAIVCVCRVLASFPAEGKPGNKVASNLGILFWLRENTPAVRPNQEQKTLRSRLGVRLACA